MKTQLVINIKELSVGNWIKNTNGNIGKVIGITEQGEVIVRYSENSTCYSEPAVLEPVEITPKILEKNGFKWDKKIQRYVWEYEGYYMSCDLHGKTRIYVVNDYVLGLPLYVHQLQNALTLCGIDKEIEL